MSDRKISSWTAIAVVAIWLAWSGLVVGAAVLADVKTPVFTIIISGFVIFIASNLILKKP